LENLDRFIKRSAPPDGQTDEQHQEWLLARASEHFAKIDETDNQRKRLRLAAHVSAEKRRGLGAKSGFWALCVLTDFSQESAGSYGC